MRTNLAILSTTNDPVAVHELRLHSKKINSVINLLNWAGGQEMFSTKPLRKMVSEAGNTRLAELNLKTLQELGYKNEDIEHEQNKIIEKGYSLLRKRIKAYEKNIGVVEQKFASSVFDVKNKQVLIFFLTVINQLSIDFFWPIDRNKLHENRKKIKDLIYVYKILPENLQRKIALNMDYLDRLQEQIGIWHDLELALVFLNEQQLDNEPVYVSIKEKQAGLYELIKMEVQVFDSIVRGNVRSES